jgi:hypothetical protein
MTVTLKVVANLFLFLAMIKTNVPLMVVTKTLDVLTKKLIVMIKTNVLRMIVTPIKVVPMNGVYHVMIMMLVQVTDVALPKDVYTIKLTAMIVILVLMIPAIRP